MRVFTAYRQRAGIPILWLETAGIVVMQPVLELDCLQAFMDAMLISFGRFSCTALNI